MFNLFKKKTQEVPEPIGIAVFTTYTSCMGSGTSYMPPITTIMHAPGFGARDFFPFYQVDDTIDKFIKVNGAWLEKKDVFLFQDKTSNDLILYKRRMKKKYKIEDFTDVHQLYNDGLTVDFGLSGAENNFYNKKLEKKLRKRKKW